MGIWKTTKTSDGRERSEIDVKELTLRLQSLKEGCTIEIVQLALESLLEEIKENAK